MTAEEIFEMAKIFVSLGVKKIRLTGGEPLLRKDFGEIALKLSELPVKLSLTTNAVLIDRHIQKLKRAGVFSINVSLDTLRGERFFAIAKRNDFQKVMSNINLLLENGFYVKLNAVLMKGVNDDEILDFIKWTKDVNIHVRFIEFMPFDGNSWQWEKIVPYKEIIKKIENNYSIEKLNDKPNDTAKAFRIKGYKGTFAVISSMTNHFCNTCNRLRITANGKMKNCLFSNDEADLLTSFRSGENIEPIIRECLSRKKAKHGGISELENLTSDDSQASERSMILIGG